MAGITIRIIDGANQPRDMGASLNSEGNLAPHSVPLIGGAPIGETNRLPVGLPAGLATVAAQNIANSALGAPEDAAWGGSGGGSLVALSKAVIAAIKGTLTTSLTVTGSPVSSLNPLAVSLPATAATAAKQDTTNAALGAPADAAWATGAGSLIAIAKALAGLLSAPLLTRAQAVAITPRGVAVNTSSAELVPASATRRYLMLRNVGTADARLGFGADAIADAGYPLYAGGDGLLFDLNVVPSQRITAIAGAATTIMVLEA
jgi:hypothetical protein